MPIPGITMPPELAEIIAVHRGLFGGFTMTATEGGEDAQATTDDAATQTETGDQSGAQAASEPATETAEQTIARLTSELSAARAEAGKSRVNAKQAAADEARTQLVTELGKALGLVKDDAPTDPAALQQQIAATGAENAALKQAAQFAETRQVALLAAAAQGANPAALLDSNSFLESIKGLAPADTEKINAATKTAIENNPTLKAQAAKSGPEFTGGTGGQAKPTTLEEAVAAKLGATSS